MAKYIDKFISEFDKRLDDHLNLSVKRSEEFLKVRDEQIELEKGVLLSSLKPGKPKPFLGLGGWSGHKYKDLKGLYEYVFQKDGSMHLPPEKVKGKINPDYTFFNDYIIYLATYNVILNAKNKIFIQVKNYPGAPAEQDDMELLDIPEPVVERTEKITEFKTKADFPFGPGDKNLKIKDIQKWLGFTGKSVDGSFGNGTYNALLYGGYLIGLTASVTPVIYDELKRDFENGVVEKKSVAVVVPTKPDPYIEFLKKAETIKEKGGGRYWFNTFMDIAEKNYIKNPAINEKIKDVMEYCDTVFGMGGGNIDSIPEIDIIGNRAIDIYYMKNYGSVGKEYDNYLKFYSVIISDNYINMDKGALGVMSRDVFPNLIPCFPEPRTIAMDTIDIDSAMDVTKKNPEDESLLLYNAFLEAAEYYSQNRDVIDTIPLAENKWEVLPSAARHLLDPKWETLGDYTFEFSMEDVIKVISGPSGPGSNIFIPSYVGLTESSVNVGELFREYRGEIVSAEILDEYKQEESDVLDEVGVTGDYDYMDDESGDTYDELDSEYSEVEADVTEPLEVELSNEVVAQALLAAEQEAERLPPIDSNSSNPFNDAKGSGIPPSESGKGYPVHANTTKFVNKHTNGIYPAKQHDDGTFIVVKAEGTGLKARHWLDPNPQYIQLLKTVNVPLSNGKISAIKVHPEYATKLNAVFEVVKQRGLQKYIFSCAGGLAVRNVTNGVRLSNHSYGFAIDVNSSKTGWGYGSKWDVNKKTVKVGKNVYSWGENEEGFYEIVKIMNQYGIGWLGSMDPMHFSMYESG